MKTHNKTQGDALMATLARAAEVACRLQTPAGKDAYRAICEVMREFSLSRDGGFNEEQKP